MEQESMFTVMNYLATKGRGAGEKLRGKSDESDESDESDRSTADADARNSPPVFLQ